MNWESESKVFEYHSTRFSSQWRSAPSAGTGASARAGKKINSYIQLIVTGKRCIATIRTNPMFFPSNSHAGHCGRQQIETIRLIHHSSCCNRWYILTFHFSPTVHILTSQQGWEEIVARNCVVPVFFPRYRALTAQSRKRVVIPHRTQELTESSLKIWSNWWVAYWAVWRINGPRSFTKKIPDTEINM